LQKAISDLGDSDAWPLSPEIFTEVDLEPAQRTSGGVKITGHE